MRVLVAAVVGVLTVAWWVLDGVVGVSV